MDHVHARIKGFRKAKKLTQAEAAELLGVTQGYWGKIERGEAKMTIELLARLSRALNIPVEKLLYSSDDYTMIEHELQVFSDLEELYYGDEFDEILRRTQVEKGAECFRNNKDATNRLLGFGVAALNQKCRYEEAKKLCEDILNNLTDSCSIGDKVALYQEYGYSLLYTKDYEKSLDVLEEANKMMKNTWDQAIDYRTKVRVYRDLGKALNRLGRFNEAEQYIKLSLKYTNRTYMAGMKEKAHAEFMLGSIAYWDKEYGEATQHFLESYRFYEFVGDVRHQLETMNNVAYTYDTQGNKQKAKEAYERVLELARKNPEHVTSTLISELKKEGYEI